MARRFNLRLRSGGVPHVEDRRRVQTFVTWFKVTESMASLAALDAAFPTTGPSQSISHIAFQAWNPAPGGASVQYSTSDGAYPTATNVDTIRDWAQARGIKALLCVHNLRQPLADLWDWPLAKSAFDTNQAAFITSLVAAMNADSLDGIDVDFEGFDADNPAYDFDDDKAAFISFLTNLKAAMGPTKFLSVNCVAYLWNAPKLLGWGADIGAVVDGVNSMGYNETGINAADYPFSSYTAQRGYAAGFERKFAMGMPCWLDEWQGDPAQTQLDWWRDDRECGVTLWEAAFAGAGDWDTAAIWATLKRIHDQAIT